MTIAKSAHAVSVSSMEKESIFEQRELLNMGLKTSAKLPPNEPIITAKEALESFEYMLEYLEVENNAIREADKKGLNSISAHDLYRRARQFRIVSDKWRARLRVWLRAQASPTEEKT